MHTSAWSCTRTVALPSLFAVLGLLMADPTIRQSADFEVAALPPQAKSPVERLSDPRTERGRAPPRRKPAEFHRA